MAPRRVWNRYPESRPSVKAAIAEAVNSQLVPLWSDGTLRVVVNETFALTDVESAYESFGQPGKFGKILLINE